ncbi:hypothetical protein AK812_SmicGene16013 [Symbiodinium microadriaticum]|uniref:Uncharacterized protein n=1 Tax=Symbiodinium microadriaticum TaxID=2951 RepID=A0A1Q9E1H2_SYMMI|nr:hypothetical protein AK812_SmicGene16013 [Symbiodinium microadriaticum]
MVAPVFETMETLTNQIRPIWCEAHINSSADGCGGEDSVLYISTIAVVVIIIIIISSNNNSPIININIVVMMMMIIIIIIITIIIISSMLVDIAGIVVVIAVSVAIGLDVRVDMMCLPTDLIL